MEIVVKTTVMITMVAPLYFVRRNRTVPQMVEKINTGRDQTVSARTVHPQLNREGYYSRARVYEALTAKTFTFQSSV